MMTTKRNTAHRRLRRAGVLMGSLALAAALPGCGASLPGLSTSAVSKTPQEYNTPTNRAFQVAGTSARALKCGYNFDPVKLRTQYLAAESATDPASVDQLGRIYDTAYNGVTKAIAGQGENYCSEQKVASIKSALSRHLAGDYAPPPPAPDEEGLLGALTPESSGDSDYAKKMQGNPTLDH
jgi:hypothetical protein